MCTFLEMQFGNGEHWGADYKAAMHAYLSTNNLSPPPLARIRLDAAILQDREPLFALSPCTLRTRSSCLCWQIKWKDLTYLLDHSLKTRVLMQAHAIDAITASIYLYPYAWYQHTFEVVGGRS